MNIKDLLEGEIVAPLESYGVCAGCKNARLRGTKPFVRRGDLLYCPPCDPLPRRHFCQVCKVEIEEEGALCEFHWEERYAASFEEKPDTGIPGGFTKKDAPLRGRSEDPHENAKHHARIASGQ